MEYCLKCRNGDCHICATDGIIIVSPEGYKDIKCSHYLCEGCWENTGKVKPLCPMCREEVSCWMLEIMNFKICTERNIIFDPFYYEDSQSNISPVSETIDGISISHVPTINGTGYTMRSYSPYRNSQMSILSRVAPYTNLPFSGPGEPHIIGRRLRSVMTLVSGNIGGMRASFSGRTVTSIGSDSFRDEETINNNSRIIGSVETPEGEMSGIGIMETFSEYFTDNPARSDQPYLGQVIYGDTDSTFISISDGTTSIIGVIGLPSNSRYGSVFTIIGGSNTEIEMDIEAFSRGTIFPSPAPSPANHKFISYHFNENGQLREPGQSCKHIRPKGKKRSRSKILPKTMTPRNNRKRYNCKSNVYGWR